ncbi:MAG: hypothetical protein D6730_06915 [Bacteroidetes bacterium]|nr:MAG: hypothetical protein D6730_06915 [Bacteroidota bacterium]
MCWTLTGQNPHDKRQTGFSTVNEVFYRAPDDLSSQVLLVPAFDVLEMQENDPPDRKAYVEKVNQAAIEANEALRQVIAKAYPYRFQLIGLGEVAAYKEKGYKYFLDLVIMPKQMERVKQAAMVPAYKKFTTANRMYRNGNYQFHYYFYIRDIQKDNAYVGKKLKGDPEVYRGISRFLRNIAKE